MDLADEAYRDWQTLQGCEAVVHRPHVVDDLVDVIRDFRAKNVGFGRQQVLQRALRALNLARKHRLFAHVHVNKEVGIGQCVD